MEGYPGVMSVKKVIGIYFSPTGSTKSVVRHMLKEFEVKREEIDLTPYETRDNSYSFAENDLAIIGMPVFGGRVPLASDDRYRLLKGNNTPAVLVANYGNIHYSNALYELQQIVAQNGFKTIAAAVVISQHSVVSEIASGRPDPQDLAAITSFIRQVQAKLAQSDCHELAVSKHAIPEAIRGKQPIKPHGNKKCTDCGTCGRLCPVRAIDNPRKTAGQTCIRCMRCVRHCPKQARVYRCPVKLIGRPFLTLASRGVEKQPEFFL